MKFNNLTYNISIALLVVTALYTLVYSGITGVLLCTAITLIAAGFINQFELVAAVAVVFAMFYTFFLKKWLRKLEPFEDLDTPKQILGRLAGMENAYNPVQQQLKDPRREPYGVYDPAVEGFEDVSSEKKEGAPSESAAAPAKRTNEVDAQQVEEVTSALKKKSDDEVAKEEFQSATNNLFKMGKMPSENMDGPKLDSGSTLMKAMESFKPEQISAMTNDTKALLETQKGLMQMLNQMRPVLADGKELLQTFTGMFGGAGMPLKL
jgi:hypothetical protein